MVPQGRYLMLKTTELDNILLHDVSFGHQIVVKCFDEGSDWKWGEYSCMQRVSTNYEITGNRNCEATMPEKSCSSGK